VVLGDERGRLTAIGWEFDGSDSVRVGKVDLGIVSGRCELRSQQASPPTTLTYIDNGVMFVSSACGDSLLVSFSLPETAQAQSAGTTAPRNIKGKGRAQDNIDSGTWTITLDDEATAEQSVKERWMNLAPLKDLAVVEEEDGRVVS
jgi:DNA damage-binding protein 1